MIFLFDCFGVVVDWKSEYVVPLWAKYAKVSESEFKNKIAEDLELCETGHISMSELWENFGRKFNVSPLGFEHIFIECFQKKAKLNDDVMAIVKSLPSVMLTNQIPWHAEYCRKRGWFSSFSKVFLSFDLGYRKPDSRTYQLVLKELGVMPSDALLIDDKAENVKSAQMIGMKGVVFQSASQLKADLEKVYNVRLDRKTYG